jgi:hypothetical protein
MTEIHTWFSRDEPELKIGEPVKGTLGDGTEHVVRAATIVFHRGFATVEMTPENTRMLAHTARTYPLEDLGVDSDVVPAASPGSVDCPVCGKTLKTPFGLKSHLRSHKDA